MIDSRHGWNKSFKPVYLGFFFSLILTLAAFRIIERYHLSALTLDITLITIAMAQAIFQLVFFLQLGLEDKPRWNLMMVVFTILVMFIIIGGSMWIMYNLNYNVMIE